MKNPDPNVTVGRLIDELSVHDRNKMVYFNGLDYNRVRSRSDTVVNFEFDQVIDYMDDGDIVVS